MKYIYSKYGAMHARASIAVAACILALLSFSCSEDPEVRFQRLIQEGDARFERGQYREALESYKAAQALKPGSSEAPKKIGGLYLSYGDFNRAAAALQRVIELEPNAYDARITLTKVQLLFGDYLGADAGIRRLLESVSDQPGVHVLQGDLLLLKSQYEQAEKAYATALSLSPGFEPAMIRLACCLLVQGKTAEAEKAYEAVPALKPAGANLLLQMGNYWKLKGEPQKAEQFFLEACSSDPSDIWTRWHLVNYYFDQERLDSALDTLNAMPQSATVKKMQTEALLSLNRLDAAQAILMELSAEEPNDLDLLLLKGKYHLLRNETVHAVGNFEAVVKSEPNLALAHYLLGVAYLSGGQIALAQKAFTETLKLDAGYSSAELALADIYYMRGNLEPGAEHAQRVSQSKPESYRAQMVLGHILMMSGQNAQALKSFEAAYLLNPGAASPLYYMAVVEELTGGPPDALALYEKLLSRHPDLVDAALRYARLLLKSGEHERALKHFNALAASKAQNGYIRHILGEIYLDAGDVHKAKECFEQAVALEPNLASSYLELARIYQSAGDIQNEIQVLETGSEKVPQFPEAYTRLARIYEQQGEIGKAAANLEKGLQAFPKNPIIANNLAWIYLEEDGSLEKAFNLAQTAYDARPEDPVIIDTLAWVMYKKKLLTRASRLLAEAVARKPDHPLIQFHWGVIQNENGEMIAAARSLKRSLELELSPPYKDQATRLLSELEGAGR
jgi:tetratricopeptide (TPR) repeat protein